MSAPGWPEMTRVFGRIGLLSFGGPAAQIAVMHRELVEHRPWLGEEAFLRALSLCMLLPGPEAMQLATYAGWRLRGVAGGLLAGLLFVVPGALVIAVLALGYACYGQLPLVTRGIRRIHRNARRTAEYGCLGPVAGRAASLTRRCGLSDSLQWAASCIRDPIVKRIRPRPVLRRGLGQGPECGTILPFATKHQAAH